MEDQVDEILKRFLAGEKLTDQDRETLKDKQLQRLYKEAQKTDDNERAARLQQLAWNTYTSLQNVHSPVERMNRAGAKMLEALNDLNKTFAEVGYGKGRRDDPVAPRQKPTLRALQKDEPRGDE